MCKQHFFQSENYEIMKTKIKWVEIGKQKKYAKIQAKSKNY